MGILKMKNQDIKKESKKILNQLNIFSVPHYNNANFTQMDHDYTKVQNI